MAFVTHEGIDLGIPCAHTSSIGDGTALAAMRRLFRRAVHSAIPATVAPIAPHRPTSHKLGPRNTKGNTAPTTPPSKAKRPGRRLSTVDCRRPNNDKATAKSAPPTNPQDAHMIIGPITGGNGAHSPRTGLLAPIQTVKLHATPTGADAMLQSMAVPRTPRTRRSTFISISAGRWK